MRRRHARSSHQSEAPDVFEYDQEEDEYDDDQADEDAHADVVLSCGAAHRAADPALPGNYAPGWCLRVVRGSAFTPPATIRMAVNPLVQFRMPSHPALGNGPARGEGSSRPFRFSADPLSDLPNGGAEPSGRSAPSTGELRPQTSYGRLNAAHVNGRDKGKQPERPTAIASPQLTPLFDAQDQPVARLEPINAAGSDDLSKLSQQTREAMEARLRLLDRVDADLARTKDELRRALDAIDG